MFNKSHFLDSLRHETKVCRHLFGKLDEDQLTYRPGESMRSTLELLRYLTYCAVGPAQSLVQGDWAVYKERVVAAESLDAAQFPAAMDRQLQELEELLAQLSDEDLLQREATLPTGVRQSLGAALVNMSLKYLSTYRMQLFLYAKASGSAGLDTWNNWAGQDRK